MDFGQQIKGFMCFGLLVWLNVAPWDLRFPCKNQSKIYLTVFQGGIFFHCRFSQYRSKFAQFRTTVLKLFKLLWKKILFYWNQTIISMGWHEEEYLTLPKLLCTKCSNQGDFTWKIWKWDFCGFEKLCWSLELGEARRFYTYFTTCHELRLGLTDCCRLLISNQNHKTFFK